METIISLKLRDNKALDMLKEMETESLIELISFESNVSDKKVKKSDRFRGIFNKQDKISFDQHTNEMRNEWQNT